jgi:hypothetical protein
MAAEQMGVHRNGVDGPKSWLERLRVDGMVEDPTAGKWNEGKGEDSKVSGSVSGLTEKRKGLLRSRQDRTVTDSTGKVWDLGLAGKWTGTDSSGCEGKRVDCSG